MAGAPHLEAFLDAAKYFKGLKENPDGSDSFTDPLGKEMLSLSGYPYYHGAWCAILVSACAEKAGIAGKLLLKREGVGGVTSNAVDYCGGKWIDGPYHGYRDVYPEPGDLITFTWKWASSYYSGYKHGCHIGIVMAVNRDNETITTIEGNAGNKCKERTWDVNETQINGYVRLDWSAVGDSVGGISVGPLYQTRNDRHDMTMREVGYLDSSYQHSNTKSAIRLSVINYTSVLGDLWDIFAPMVASNPRVSTSALTGNTKIAMDYLLSVGFSASAASGVAGALKAYSNLKPDHTLYNTATDTWYYGICDWVKDRLPDIRNRVGADWKNNLSGQLSYLVDDLDLNYKGIISAIKLQQLDVETAERVAEAFVKLYTNDRQDLFISNAKLYAAEIYEKLVITTSTIIGSIANLVDKNGNPLSSKNSITIPASVPQTGIVDDYTSYSAYYSRTDKRTVWGRGTVQRTLANIWGDQGFPCNKGIAMIGGYYCVAVTTKFGNCGDVIVVTLEDNISFPAIICDEKGSDAKSEWGHIEYGKVKVIEWERVKTKDGKVQVGTGYSDVDKPHGFGDWYGKKILNITNYGSYLG